MVVVLGLSPIQVKRVCRKFHICMYTFWVGKFRAHDIKKLIGIKCSIICEFRHE